MTRETRLQLNIAGEQLELLRLDASEGLSQPFLVTLDILSTLGEFDLFPHLGKPAMVESLRDGAHMRYFHGIITDGHLIGDSESGSHSWSENAYRFRITLQPKSFFHEQGRDYRIFQDQSVIDIIKDVLTRRGIDYELKLQSGSGGELIRKYCVQYGESDMSFVYRLMEEHGLYYYYRHDADKHVIVLCDAPSAHTQIKAPHLNFNPFGGSMSNAGSPERGHSDEYVSIWHEHLSSGAEAVASMHDYNFKTPKALHPTDAREAAVHVKDEIEVYVWPGRFDKSADGKKLATYLLESRRAQRVRYDGSTPYTGLQAGYTFKLHEHVIERFNDQYLVIASHTSLANESYRSGGSSDDTEVHFTAIPSKMKFRAPFVTPRPVARGPETAVVVGPSGEEIYVDKYGRIKVQFHWDRLGRKDEKSSCWIRVSQTGGLGNIILPRIGHEVLIDFIAGDPDRPIVVGRVFNEDYMPVYPLPANKTRAVWRSKTYKRDSGDSQAGTKALDTGKPGANEIRMEDNTGQEEFFLHAEKDLNTRVRHCETHHVGKDQSIDIGKNRTEVVGDNETITIGKNRTEKVGENEKITINKNRIEEVMIDETVTIHGERKLTIDGQDTQHIGKRQSIECDDEIIIKAKKSITLIVGMSKIVIDTSSITCKTMTFEADGATTAKVSGAKTDVQGSALVNVQGAIVKIN